MDIYHFDFEYNVYIYRNETIELNEENLFKLKKLYLQKLWPQFVKIGLSKTLLHMGQSNRLLGLLTNRVDFKTKKNLKQKMRTFKVFLKTYFFHFNVLIRHKKYKTRVKILKIKLNHFSNYLFSKFKL